MKIINKIIDFFYTPITCKKRYKLAITKEQFIDLPCWYVPSVIGYIYKNNTYYVVVEFNDIGEFNLAKNGLE